MSGCMLCSCTMKWKKRIMRGAECTPAAVGISSASVSLQYSTVSLMKRPLTTRGCRQASQSLLSVGNKPILQHFQSPRATAARWHAMNASFGNSSECFGD